MTNKAVGLLRFGVLNSFCTKKEVDVYRLVAELTVIILGVLIALGVDAWWERTQDEQLEVQWNETARPILYRTYSFDQIQIEGESRSRRQAPIEASELDLFELRNAIADRRKFATAHLRITRDLSALVKQLQGQAPA